MDKVMTASEWFERNYPNDFLVRSRRVCMEQYAEYRQSQTETTEPLIKPTGTVIVTAKWPDCIYEVGDVLHRVGQFYFARNRPKKHGIHWQDVESNIVNFEVVPA